MLNFSTNFRLGLLWKHGQRLQPEIEQHREQVGGAFNCGMRAMTMIKQRGVDRWGTVNIRGEGRRIHYQNLLTKPSLEMYTVAYYNVLLKRPTTFYRLSRVVKMGAYLPTITLICSEAQHGLIFNNITKKFVDAMLCFSFRLYSVYQH
jgi:hypothetical protein